MLPLSTAYIAGVPVRVLIDSGCEQSVITEHLAHQLCLLPKGPSQLVTMLNGQTTRCKGLTNVNVSLQKQQIHVLCLIAPELVCNCDMILGMDAIIQLGGVEIDVNSNVVFKGDSSVAGMGVVSPKSVEVLEVNDIDFDAAFDGEHWVVEWKWKNGAPILTNQCAEYTVTTDKREVYDQEVQKWIENGWLQPHDETIHGRVDGIIPLMAASQPNKPKKVRPVMDYSKELNSFVKSNPGLEAAVCQDKLRKWRSFGNKACVIDLKSAYLQIHVKKCLQRFQAVRYSNKLYVMTRMGFGLNVAPKVMTKILTKVLSLDERIASGTDHYIDDIWVNEEVVSADCVRKHLLQFGLITKDPVSIDNARVLGLRVTTNSTGQLTWSRDAELPVVGNQLTKRGLFSLCGKLLGHYPVAGWLRVACSYIKRLSNFVQWDEYIPESTMTMLHELISRLSNHDPVSGQWNVTSQSQGKVWCDASSIALGVCLETGGQIVEDAAWLRNVNDSDHINVAELEAVIKGLNLAVKWKLKDITVATDSATVHGWVSSVVADSRRPKVTGLSEMVIKRRLNVIAQLVEEYNLELCIQLVKSEQNKADQLTRVSKKWMKVAASTVCAAASSNLDSQLYEDVRRTHDEHHLGIDRTLYVARSLLGDQVTHDIAQSVVKQCHVCKRIDPAPVTWEKGTLSTENTWCRLAVDVTHYKNTPYLTVVDCGPSRFALWRKLRNETASVVKAEFERIFNERGPCVELLSDNGPCFRDSSLNSMLSKWGVVHTYSCAYKASGNGLVERNHRTIKRIAARSGCNIDDAVYWYNNTPNSFGNVPALSLYAYPVHLRNILSAADSRQPKDTTGNPYALKDYVYVKPNNNKCTSVWKVGQVTKLISNTTVEVNGTNRHVSDLRFAWHDNSVAPRSVDIVDSDGDIIGEPETDSTSVTDSTETFVGIDNAEADCDIHSSDSDNSGTEIRGQVRDRRPPKWLADFYV